MTTPNVQFFFDFIDFTVVAPAMKVVPALSKATVAKFARNRDLGRVVTESTLKLEQDDVIFVNAQGQAQIGKAHVLAE